MPRFSLRSIALATGLIALVSCGSDDDTGATTEHLDLPPDVFDDSVVPTEGHPGWTHGAFSVSDADGQATYDLPIVVPDGRNGMQPSLALSYRSRGPDGLVGNGWALSGLSMITRCPRSLRIDGVTEGTFMDEPGKETLCLDGDRLVEAGSGSFHGGGRYRRRRDGSERIERDLSDGPLGSFRVFGADGTIRTYGGFEDGYVAGATVVMNGTAATEGPVATYAWLLTRIRDRFDNGLEVHYERQVHEDGSVEVLPTEIVYTSHPTLGPGQRAVKFFYEGRPYGAASVVQWIAGLGLRSTRRLAAIETRGPGGPSDVLRRYELTHDVGQQTRAMRLREIRECDGFSVCRAPVQFRYEDPEMREPDTDLRNTFIDSSVLSGQVLTPIRGIRGPGSDFLHLTRSGSGDMEWRVARRYADGGAWVDEHGWPAAFIPVGMPEDPHYARTGSRLEPFGQLADGTHRFLEVADAIGGLVEIRLSLATLSVTAEGDIGGTTGDGPSPLSPHSYALSRTDLFICHEPERSLAVLQGDLDGDGAVDPIFGGHCWNGDTPETYDHDWLFAPANGSHLAREFRLLSANWVAEEADPTVVEMNGDGRQELLARDGSLAGVASDGSPEPLRSVNLPEGAHVFLDLNGDGLTDLVDITTGQGRLNIGGAFGPSHEVINAEERADLARPPAVQPWDTMIADFNLDGRDDLAIHLDESRVRPCDGCAERVERERELRLYLSTGEQFRPLPFGRPGWKAFNSWTTGLSDVDGDGLLDFLVDSRSAVCEYPADPNTPPTWWAPGCVPASAAPAGARYVDHMWLKPGPFTGIADGLVEVRTGEHVVATAEYELSRHSGAQCDYPLQCHSSGVRVVSSHTDALDRRYRHHYRGARSDLRGQGFLGFTRHYVVSEANGAVREIQFDQTRLEGDAGYAFALLPMREVDYVPLEGGRFLAEETVNQHQVSWLSSAHYTVHLHSRVTRSYDLQRRPPGGCSGEYCQDVDLEGQDALRELYLNLQYDPLGVLRRRTLSAGQLVLSQVEIETEDRPIEWMIGLPTRVTVRSWAQVADQVEVAARVSSFSYDSLGFLASQTIEPTRPELRSVIRYLPDEFGHVKQVDQIADGVETRTSRMRREDREHIYLLSTANAMGHEELVAIHPTLGVPVLVRDPNGVEAHATYDGFGRPVSSFDDTAPSAVSAVRFEPGEGDTMVVNAFTVGHAQSRTQVDHLGRAHLSRERLPDGSWSETELVYDAIGRLSDTIGPRRGLGAFLHRSYRYDAAGRPVAIEHHDGQPPLEYSYSGLDSVTIDRRGNQHYSRVDFLGRPVWARSEVNGEGIETSQVYGPFNTLRLVTDAAGNQYETRYDPYGRPTYRKDPDAGDRAFEYDRLGQLRFERDEAGTALSEVRRRDRLGRVIEQWAREDGTTSYEWDTAPNGIGLLSAAVTGERYRVRTEYTYAGGQLTSLTQTINTQPLTVSRTFDDHGRLSTLTYPSTSGGGLTVSYDYGAINLGRAQSIRNVTTGQELWHADEWDALGRVVEETQGNGHVTRRYFDPLTARLRRIAVTGAVMEIGYGFDADGNLDYRIDHQLGRTETFEHDTLGRLTRWSPSWADSIRYEYDGIGNLTGLGGIVQRYGEDGRGPHQLTSTTEGVSFTYDGLGRRNELGSGGRITQWTSFDLPREIEASAGRFRFGYDAFGQRVVKDGPDDTTVYLGDLFESHKTGERVFRVFNEQRAIAEIVEVGGTRRTRYLHDDHLGSTSAITDENGNVLQRVVHDPFGRRRATEPDGETPMGPLSSRGFTSHEHDDDLGLINMRGRMYDPTTGRFLTPDPLIRSTLSSQALNAYSYVENRPLSLVDPSGYGGDNPQYSPPPATPEPDPGAASRGPNWGDAEPDPSSTSTDPAPSRARAQQPVPTTITPSVPRPSPAATTPAESAPTVRQGPASSPLSFIPRPADLIPSGRDLATAFAGNASVWARTAVESAAPGAGALLEVDWERELGIDTDSGWFAVGQTHGVVGTIVVGQGLGMLGSGGPTAVRLASTAGGYAPAQVVRTVARGESLWGLFEEMARLHRASGVEHALVSLTNGQRLIVSGGRGGIEFVSWSLRHIIAHTHPAGLRLPGASTEDVLALRSLAVPGVRRYGQLSSYLIELAPGRSAGGSAIGRVQRFWQNWRNPNW